MKDGPAKRTLEKIERRKASVRAKVEHPFRVIKRQFGLMKVRFRGLAKNTTHLISPITPADSPPASSSYQMRSPGSSMPAGPCPVGSYTAAALSS